jgi:hypothetical protein
LRCYVQTARDGVGESDALAEQRCGLTAIEPRRQPRREHRSRPDLLGGAYKETLGPLSEVWFTAADGLLDEQALARYRGTGQVWAEWDCSPAPGDGGDVAPKISALTAG